MIIIKRRKKILINDMNVFDIRNYLLENNFVIEASFDPVFKKVMGSCPNYLSALVSSITGIDKNIIKDTFKEKNVEYKVNNALERKKTSDFIFECMGYIINLECNKGYYEGLLERNEAYFGKIKGELLNKGEQYSKDIKVIQINFDIFDNYEKILGNDEISDYKIRNDIGLIETETSVKYHIDMKKKLDKYYRGEKLTKQDKLLLILVLDDYNEIIKISEGDEELMEAGREIYNLTSDIDNIGLYDIEKRRKEETELRIQYQIKLAREEAIKNGMEEGMQRGIKQGMKQGMKQGAKESKMLFAKSLLKDNFSIADISKYTGLSKNEIIMLK